MDDVDGLNVSKDDFSSLEEKLAALDPTALVSKANSYGIKGKTVDEVAENALAMPVYQMRLEDNNMPKDKDHMIALLEDTLS